MVQGLITSGRKSNVLVVFWEDPLHVASLKSPSTKNTVLPLGKCSLVGL